MNPAGHSITKSLITEPARKAVMEEIGKTVSSITCADRLGPTLLLDAVEPDGVRFIKRYCEWLSRGLVADSYIAARFDRSFQRLRRLGGNSPLVQQSKDRPSHWDGPAPNVLLIQAVLTAWSKDDRLSEQEKRILNICINECRARLDRVAQG